jgi:hypothetical protein
VALFCLIYLAQRRQVRPALTALCATALITGGILTVSKIFLLAALPLAVLVTLRSPRGRIRTVVCAAAALAGRVTLNWPHLLL